MADDLIGTKIDGYTIEKRLGAGASGSVYLVRLPGRQRFAALKLMTGKPDSGETLRFRREFGAIARCRHPGIITVYAIGEYRGSPYFLMEYVKGEDFLSFFRKDLRSRTPLPTQRIPGLMDIMNQILDALQYLHGEQIIHQDMKPANIMVTEDSRVKLLDFGLARTRANASALQPSGGTAGYLSPEQLWGRPADPRTDLYALGVCLYEVLCGIHPFGSHGTWQEMVSRQLEGSFILPSQLHREFNEIWDHILERMLVVNPEKRFQTTGQILQEFKRFARDETQETARKNYGNYGLLPAAWIDQDGILKACLKRTQENKPMMVAGIPPGGGATRFIEELRRALPAGTVSLVFDMSLDEDSLDFLRRLFETVMSFIQPSGDADQRSVRFISDFLLPGETQPALPPRQLRQMFLESFRKLGGMLPRQKKILLILDNLREYDELFKSAWAGFFEQLPDHVSVIVVGIPGKYFLSFKPDVIQWNPWEIPTVETYLKSVLADEKIPGHFTRRITEISGGRPARVHDLLSGWIREGSLRFDEEKWWIGPPALSGAIALEHLNQDDQPAPPRTSLPKFPVEDRIDRELLRIMAVFGKEAPFHVITAAFTAREELILEILDRLIRAGWIEEEVHSSQTYYRFRRTEFSAFIYESISPFHQGYLHRRLADIVLKSSESTQEPVEFLSDHYRLGDDPSLSLPFAEKAVERARRRFEMNKALKYLEMIQDITNWMLNHQIDGQSGPIHYAPRFDSLSPSAVIQEYRNAQSSKSRELQIRWLRAASERGQIRSLMGEYGLAFEEFQRMLARARDYDLPAIEGDALRFIGQVLYYQKNYEESLKFFEDALKVRQKIEDLPGVADCLNALGALAQQMKDLDKAQKYFLQAMKAKMKLNDLKGVAYLRNNLGNILFLKKKFHEALKEFQASYVSLETMDDKLGMAYSLYNQGETYREMKSWEKALQATRKALVLRQEMKDLRGEALCYREIGEIFFDSGFPEEGVQNLQKAAGLYEELGSMEDAQICRSIAQKTNKD